MGGGIPKALREIGGSTLLEHAIVSMARHPAVAEIVLAVPADSLEPVLRRLPQAGVPVTAVAGGADLGLHEITEAARLVSDAAHPEANIIFGTVIDDTLGDEVRVTVIAAGFDGGAPLPRLTTGNRAGVTEGFVSSATQPSARESIDLSARDEEVGRPLAPATRAVSFEDSPSRDADDLDVPDFLK